MKCLPYGKREIFRLSPECEMKSTRRRSDFTRRRRISYCEAVFHPPEGWISLKKARRSVLFSAKERPNGAYNEVKTIKSTPRIHYLPLSVQQESFQIGFVMVL